MLLTFLLALMDSNKLNEIPLPHSLLLRILVPLIQWFLSPGIGTNIAHVIVEEKTGTSVRYNIISILVLRICALILLTFLFAVRGTRSSTKSRRKILFR
jgi:Na+/proline symporter